MCWGTGSYAQYAGVALHPVHGGRGLRTHRMHTVPLAAATGPAGWIHVWGQFPFFVTERTRSEAALIQVVQEAFVQGVSTRKMEKLAHSLGIENISRSRISEMTKGLNDQVREFRSRALDKSRYPVIWVDALYEKVRMDGRVISMAVQVVCGVNE
ncbi:MAG: IS256 family transposase, partial [Clostridiales bacterium]|nr:IS256 family transposase [Clostridiales bacterium]